MKYDIIIKNGTVIDGSGAAGYAADVAVKDGVIAAVGRLEGAEAEQVIDAAGKLVTPGMIDMHSHADVGSWAYPEMESMLGQGVTSCFSGHCGMGVAPVYDWWIENGVESLAVNQLIPPILGGSYMPGFNRTVETLAVREAVKKYMGIDIDWTTYAEYLDHMERIGQGCNISFNAAHSQLRTGITGLDWERELTAEELELETQRLRECFEAGAWGVSLGFDYKPGTWTPYSEALELAKAAAEYDRVVCAHTQQNYRARCGVTNERMRPIDGYRELMELGLESGARVHISHIQSGFEVVPDDETGLRAGVEATLAVIEEYRAKGVRVTWDVLQDNSFSGFFHYPLLATRFYAYIKDCGGMGAFARTLGYQSYRRAIHEEVIGGKHRAVSPFLRIGEDLAALKALKVQGKTLEQWGEEQGTDALYAALELLHRDMGTIATAEKKLPSALSAVVDMFSMREDASIGIDSDLYNYDVHQSWGEDMPWESGSPKAFCSFAGFLERKLMPPEEYMRRMCGNAARAAGFEGRGLVKEGYFADLLVLDWDNIRANGSNEHPAAAPDGFDCVIVNGRVAVDHKKHLNPLSGKILRK